MRARQASRAPALLRFAVSFSMHRQHLSLVASLLLALAAGADLNASPLKDPRRVINGQAADLSPLFKWWGKREGPRPLSAWVRLTGSVVGTNAYGWIVEARVEKTKYGSKPGEDDSGDSSRRVLLRNPPVQDQAEFDRIHDRLTELTQEHSTLAQEGTQVKSQADTINKQQQSLRRYRLHSRLLAAEAGDLNYSQKQTKEQLKPVDEQIQDLKKKLAAFPNPDHYEVDCFALKTVLQYQKLPVFDHGQVYR